MPIYDGDEEELFLWTHDCLEFSAAETCGVGVSKYIEQKIWEEDSKETEAKIESAINLVKDEYCGFK